jgi:hypothetical protein
MRCESPMRIQRTVNISTAYEGCGNCIHIVFSVAVRAAAAALKSVVVLIECALSHSCTAHCTQQ